MVRMHRLAVGALAGFAALAGCLGEKTRQCDNGATCPYDQACTEVPITDGATLCGTRRLVDACEGRAQYEPCDFSAPASQDGTCRSNVCTECTSVDVSGCHADGWNAMTAGTAEKLNGIVVPSSTTAMAVGEQRTVLRYDGAAWTNVPVELASVSAMASLRGVWGPDPDSSYVISFDGDILQYAGGAWVEVASSPQGLTAISGSSASSIMAVGSLGTVARFDGTTWTVEEQAVGAPVPLQGVWVADATTAIAVGAQGTIMRYAQGSWSVDRAQQVGEPALRAVWGRTPDDVYAVGDVFAGRANVLHYEGGTWVRLDLAPAVPGVTLTGIWGAAAEVFAVGANGALVHFDGTAWKHVAYTSNPAFTAVAGSAPDNVMAVGASGLMLRFTGRD